MVKLKIKKERKKVKHLKSYKLFESRIQDLEDDVHDILLELEDEGLQIEMSRISKDVEDDMRRVYRQSDVPQSTSVLRTDVFLEVRILRPWGSPDREMPNLPSPPGGKYPGNLFFWFEIKDAIIRLTEWYYSQSIHKPIDKKDKQFKEVADGVKVALSMDSPLRFFNSGIEFGIGWSKEEDFAGKINSVGNELFMGSKWFSTRKKFSGLDDLISFTSLRIEIKL